MPYRSSNDDGNTKTCSASYVPGLTLKNLHNSIIGRVIWMVDQAMTSACRPNPEIIEFKNANICLGYCDKTCNFIYASVLFLAPEQSGASSLTKRLFGFKLRCLS